MFLKISALRRPARLRDDERGTLTVFALLFAVLMLGFVGFAVDVMRVEARRAGLQGALDSALLAAANANQVAEPKSVVVDYLTKAGYADALVGQPTSVVRGNGRVVHATVRQSTSPMFHLYRGDFLFSTTSGAANTAPLLEVSLVLDISGSMGDAIPGTGYRYVDYGYGYYVSVPINTRMTEMQKGAKSFVNTLLGSSTNSNVSISLVPFTTYVNVGADLYQASGIRHYYNPPTNCFRFYGSYYRSLRVRGNTGYEISPRRARNGNCPQHHHEQIVPFSKDADLLGKRIDALTPRANTSIYDGVKWGAALLDPAMQSTVRSLTRVPAATNPAARTPQSQWVDPVFAGRPLNYGARGVHKMLVIMSDGANVPRNPGNRYMANICSAAKRAGITVYTVAVDMPRAGVRPMRSCATSLSHFYNVSGNKLNEAFTQIATQTVSLKLIQ